MSQSLAQYVAAEGGVVISDPVMQGELDRCRYLNRALRGKNSVFRPSGRALDIMAIDCVDEGYPVTEGNFLEALEADARAWADGSDLRRVWVELELSDLDIEAFDAEYESWLMECASTPVCPVCGVHTRHVVAVLGEELCEDCAQWSQTLAGELADGFEYTPVGQIYIGDPTADSYEARAALEQALRFYLTTTEYLS